MMVSVKPCLARPGETTRKVFVFIKFVGSQELVSVSTFHQGAYCSWISIWLRALFFRARDGKAGRKNSTAKDLRYVLKPFAHTSLLRTSVPCEIIVVPVTWMTSRRQPSVSSRALSCWAKICSERVFEEPLLKIF
jgi:hypothetical protein